MGLGRKLLAEFLGTALLLACVVGSGIMGVNLAGGNDAIALLANAGATAGQEVFHLHVHLVPRYASQPGLRALFGRSEDDLDEVHAALR